jgi:hypothetical protein
MNYRVRGVGEERAGSARSSLFFLALLIGAAFLVFAAPASAANKPVLTVTNPVSPGASLTPRIRGDADGIITSSFEPEGDVLEPFGEAGSLIEEELTIDVYTDSKCSGPLAASGTASELEGVGIEVNEPVPPDSETTFFANATDENGTSGCSNGILYQQVTTPPAPPTFAAATPSSGSNENFPRLTGTSAPNSIVFLYTDPSCMSAPVASGPASTFAAAGIQVQVSDDSTTTFHATATLAGIASTCSESSLTYQEVTPVEAPPSEPPPAQAPPTNGPGVKPPFPVLQVHPGPIANDLRPLVSGTAAEAIAVRVYTNPDCKGAPAARGSVAQLAAGLQLQVAANTTVALYGKSVDGDGDESVCAPNGVLYTDDSIAPKTRITAGPGATTRRKTVVFRFTDKTNGPGTSFLCKIDRRPWKPCRAPLRLKHLGHKRHLLRVKAFDAAGNKEKKGVARGFRVVAG